MPPTLYIALALLVVVVLRQFARVFASALGIAVALGIGVWGALTYGQGGRMTFLTAQISPAMFFGFVVLLLAFELLNLYLAVKHKKRRASSQ